VQIAVPDAEIAVGLNPASGELSAENFHAGYADRPGTALRNAMDRRVAVRAALKAGALGVFVGMIPFLGIVLTGALAVYFYRRENGLTLPTALASRLGGAAGIVAFAINAVFITLRIFVFHAQRASTEDFMKIAQRIGLNVADPDVQASIHNLFTPAGLAITLFFGMIITVVLASVGGAMGSWFLRPGKPRG
jgi:hypothetical protein